MTEYVKTAGGVEIGYDREGEGPAIVLVGGAMQMRAADESTRRLTTELAARGLTAVHYDRPGRGDSHGEAPFTLAGEVAALEALVTEHGGSALVYGSSSGAAIALAAACTLDGIVGLVLWEPPFSDELGGDGDAFLQELRAVIAQGDGEATVRFFMRGMPPEWFEGMRKGPDWPLLERAAPSLEADAEALAWTQSAPRRELWSRVRIPTVVLLGESAFPLFEAAADSVVGSVAGATTVRIPGSGHGWEPGDLADAIAATGGRRGS